MADTNKTDLGYADTLWKAADALRGQVDILAVERDNLGLKGKLTQIVLVTPMPAQTAA